jgi:hypothetical protein
METQPSRDRSNSRRLSQEQDKQTNKQAGQGKSGIGKQDLKQLGSGKVGLREAGRGSEKAMWAREVKSQNWESNKQ